MNIILGDSLKYLFPWFPSRGNTLDWLHCFCQDVLCHMTLSFWLLVTSPSLVPLGSEMVTSPLLLAPGYYTVPCGSPIPYWDLHKWSLCT